jgi:hypothetical protein
MSAVRLASVLALSCAIAAPAAAQLPHPGDIADPSSYQGSLALQQQEAASARQVEQQNQQMLQRLDQNYAAHAPRPGGGGGSAVAWFRSLPMLPAAKNPLIGRWRQTGAKPLNLGAVGLFPGAGEFVNGALGGACEQVFGKGTVAFTPTALNWVASDGHEEILNRVEYRSDRGNVVVTSAGPDGMTLIFGLPDPNHAVVAFFGCSMQRAGAPVVVASNAPRPVARPAASGAAAPTSVSQGGAAGSANAVLNLRVGVGGPGGGGFTPFSPTRIFVTRDDPDAALVRAGFAPAPGGQPVDRLFAVCKSPAQGGDQAQCTRALQAMTGAAIGFTSTDAAGQAQSPPLPPGRYYLVGFTPYQGHALLWHLPVDLRPGANPVTLGPQNGSLSR